MNIVIVAGGLGTRFGKLSIFPKILLPSYTEDSILKEDYNYFKGNNIYLIINEKFYDMVNNFITVNNININIIKSSKTSGSYNTLKEVKEYLPKEDILFLWSDLVLSKEKNIVDIINKNNNDNIIFTSDGSYRYIFENNQIIETKENNGNIPGIYYFKKLPDFEIENKKINFDLVDYIKEDLKNQNYLKIDLNNIIEYKDLKTYKKYLKNYNPNNTQTRFFNNLNIDKNKNTITKKAIDKNYYNLIDREIDWYNHYEILDKEQLNNREYSRMVPKILSTDKDKHEFTMEFLKDYISLNSFLETEKDISKIKEIYHNIKINLENRLHVPYDVNYNTIFGEDLYQEIVKKIIKRCENIKYMLINYDKDKTYNLLNKACDFLYDSEKKSKNYNKDYNTIKYYFFHGDLNGSNIMVNPNSLEVKFIDPRGYFGNTKMIGWKNYEYAKLIYSLSGYDNFNLKKQIYGETWPKLSKYLPIILEEFGIDQYNYQTEYVILVSCIYIALAGYISQDIMKANIAYEFGMKNLKETLDYLEMIKNSKKKNLFILEGFDRIGKDSNLKYIENKNIKDLSVYIQDENRVVPEYRNNNTEFSNWLKSYLYYQTQDLISLGKKSKKLLMTRFFLSDFVYSHLFGRKQIAELYRYDLEQHFNIHNIILLWENYSEYLKRCENINSEIEYSEKEFDEIQKLYKTNYNKENDFILLIKSDDSIEYVSNMITEILKLNL